MIRLLKQNNTKTNFRILALFFWGYDYNPLNTFRCNEQVGIKECTRCWWCNWKIASEPGQQAWGPLLGQESPGECFSFVLPLFSGRALGTPVGIDHLVVYGLQPGMRQAARSASATFGRIVCLSLDLSKISFFRNFNPEIVQTALFIWSKQCISCIPPLKFQIRWKIGL